MFGAVSRGGRGGNETVKYQGSWSSFSLPTFVFPKKYSTVFSGTVVFCHFELSHAKWNQCTRNTSKKRQSFKTKKTAKIVGKINLEGYLRVATIDSPTW